MSADLVTLRKLMALPSESFALSSGALVMVDAQNTYAEGIMQLDHVQEAVKQCAELLARARAAKIPIVHIQHTAGAGSPYDLDAPIGAIMDAVKPVEGEAVIVKGYPNSFHATNLHELLQGKNVKNLVVAGFMTHMCINSTARGAFNLGYNVVVPADCTATRDLPSDDGTVVLAKDVQRVALAALGDCFAHVVTRHTSIPE